MEVKAETSSGSSVVGVGPSQPVTEGEGAESGRMVGGLAADAEEGVVVAELAAARVVVRGSEVTDACEPVLISVMRNGGGHTVYIPYSCRGPIPHFDGERLGCNGVEIALASSVAEFLVRRRMSSRRVLLVWRQVRKILRTASVPIVAIRDGVSFEGSDEAGVGGVDRLEEEDRARRDYCAEVDEEVGARFRDFGYQDSEGALVTAGGWPRIFWAEGCADLRLGFVD